MDVFWTGVYITSQKTLCFMLSFSLSTEQVIEENWCNMSRQSFLYVKVWLKSVLQSCYQKKKKVVCCVYIFSRNLRDRRLFCFVFAKDNAWKLWKSIHYCSNSKTTSRKISSHRSRMSGTAQIFLFFIFE